ncbi:MAG: PA0069 family radical SAM protein, partial [Chthoniobacterales bacterium]
MHSSPPPNLSGWGEKIMGRGSSINPVNRFEPLHYDLDEWCDPPSQPHIRTQLFRDDSQSIIARNQSPDVGFETSINPYRGCEHGCAYCYARPTHEYLGFSAGVDFESKILVKLNAATLLAAELNRPGWQPQTVTMSGVTDCYQPIERKLKITRSCLQVLADFRNPTFIVTKNHLVTRDIDLLGSLAAHRAAGVTVSVTTLDAGLAQKLEPRASNPRSRLAAIRELASANIPVGVNVAPIIPGLTDHEIPSILTAAGEAGAQFAYYTIVRLPMAVSTIFINWLETHFPDRKNTVLRRIQSMRGGKLNESVFGKRMRGEGILA